MARIISIVVLLVIVPLHPLQALQITITVDGGQGTLTIVDNDPNDQNPASRIIDFDTDVAPGANIGGKLKAKGRLEEDDQSPAFFSMTLSSTGGGFHNVDPIHKTSVDVDIVSSPFLVNAILKATGEYSGTAFDPRPDEVEVRSHRVSFEVVAIPCFIGTIMPAPFTPPVPPVNQPVAWDPPDVVQFCFFPANVAAAHWSYTVGPGDQMNPLIVVTLVGDVIGVDEPDLAVSPAVSLLPATPNPFNPVTTLRYELPAAGRVQLGVWDSSGRLRASLVDQVQTGGQYAIRWDGRDVAGTVVPAGVYFIRLDWRDTQQRQKVVLIQ